MKPFLLCGTLVFLLGVLNGSELQSKTLRRSTGNSGRELSSNLLYSAYGLPYGITRFGPSSGSVITTNSRPHQTYYGTSYEGPCNNRVTDETILDIRMSVFKFITHLFRKAAVVSEGHFVFSPYTIWLSMAALAEGAEGPSRQELFSILNLPENRCLRQVFYKLATTRENPSNDVFLARNRLFITDSSIGVNRNWEEIARSQNHLHTISIPFKNNPFGETEILKRVFNAQLLNLNLNGNSFLLESLDYRGLWMSAFSDAVIETGPFYNIFGEQIGTMEYMKTIKRVNVAYVPSAKMKVIELPVGRDGRYRMLFGIILERNEYTRSLDSLNNTLIFEYLANMRPSSVPVEITVPRLTMTSETDAKKVMEDMGIKSLWTDPSATRNISDPAALPSSFIQRVTVTIDNSGVRPSVQEYSNFVPPVYNDPGLSSQEHLPESETWRNFVANRPFMFGFFDAETYMCLFAATFSKPNHD